MKRRSPRNKKTMQKADALMGIRLFDLSGVQKKELSESPSRSAEAA